MTRCPNLAPRRWIWLPLLAAPLLLALRHDHAALHPRRAGLKPSFPVQTRLEAPGSVDPGGTLSVLASVTAWAPGETVEWELRAPAGLTRLHGPDRWRGQLGRGETRTFELTFLVADGAPRELSAFARIPERPRATAGASLRVDAGGSDAPQSVRLTRDGGEILQYQGEVRLP